MKKVLCITLIVVAVICCLFFTVFKKKIAGTDQNDYEIIELMVDCNGEDKSNSYKIDETFECKLLDETYKFTLAEANQSAGTIGLRISHCLSKGANGNCLTYFELKRGERLVLETPTTDIVRYVEILWK